MSQINPLTGYIVGVQAPSRAAAEKDRQLRRMSNLGRNSAVQGDQLDLSVESAEALNEADDQPRHKSPDQHLPEEESSTPDGQSSTLDEDDVDLPRLDLTA